MPSGETVIFNWLLYAYGTAAASFALAAWLTRRGEARHFGRSLELGAIVLLTAGAWLIIRHAYHWPTMDASALRLTEIGWYAIITSLLGLAAWWGGRTSRRIVPALAGCALLWIMAIGASYLLTLHANPIWTRSMTVGDMPIFNALLWSYAVAALLAGLAAWTLRDWREPMQKLVQPTRWMMGATALWLSFWWITLTVRQAFQGESLWFKNGATAAEWYAYSAAWIVFAAVLLGLGIWRGGQALRWASLVILCVAVGKVFVLDMAHLEDLWRVGSFLGLGLSLLAVAWVYQRFVFGRRTGET
ncbi:MAG: DUF2339 domain-containing protein [Phycisphaeraceae bacterium]